MGSCWFSRNTNLLTRSGPEGSSHDECRVCRDVAGKAPPNFTSSVLFNLKLYLHFILFYVFYHFLLFSFYLLKIKNFYLLILDNRYE